MNKNYSLLFILLLFAQVSKAQLFPYNQREWNTNWTTTEFSDSFNGTSLNTAKWKVTTNFGRGNGVFVDLPNVTYSVSGGNLHLNMIYQPGYCYPLDGDTICPSYISAEISSREPYKYGIYEGRMKFAYARGSWPAFWFYGGSGADDPQYNNGYASEIDIAEYNWYVKLFGYDPKTEHVLHWWGPDGTLPMEGKTKKEASVNWNYWHTFKLIYTPYYLKFYVDGTLNWNRSKFYIINGSGQQEEIDVEDIDEYTAYYEYEGFPMHAGSIILSQQAAGNVQLPLVAPQTSLFDWVKYQKFFLAPEITCPNLICSSGTATLDVVSEATNITWQLSPSSLFSTTSGSGSTANIIAQSGASGQGTVTFTFEMPSEEEFTAEETFWVGPPSTAQFDILNVNFYGENYLYEDMANQLIANDYAYQAGTTIWEWDYGGWYHWEVTSDKSVSFVEVPYSFSYKDVNIRLYNTCGPSQWYTERFYPFEGYYLMFTPNPSTEETNLTIESYSENDFDETTEWEFEVYSGTQLLKEKKTKLKGKSAVIQTAGWQEGVYAVRVKYRDEILTGKLVVKK